MAEMGARPVHVRELIEAIHKNDAAAVELQRRFRALLSGT